MNLKNQPPVFVPRKFQAEIERLPKAALMDMVWDYAMQTAGNDNDLGIEAAMAEFRNRREIILIHRKHEKGAKSDSEATLRRAAGV